jgi:MFS family permease
MFNAVQISLTPPLLANLGYAPALIGAAISTLTIASLLSRLPAGSWYRRDRAKGVQAAAILGLAAMLVLHPFVTLPLIFLLVRLVSGLCFGVATTFNLARLIDEQPPGPERVRALGIYTTIFPVGYAIGSSLIGFVVDGWGYYVAFASGGALTALALVGLFDRTPAAVEAGAAQPADVRVVLGAPILLALALEVLLINAHYAFWNAWLALYGLAVGLTLAQVGVLRTVSGLANALGRPVGGPWLARWGAERLSLASMAAQCALVALLPVLPVFVVLIPLLIGLGTLRAVANVANMLSMVEYSEGLGLARGQTSAAFQIVTDLGVLAGPLAGGLMAQAVGPVWVFVPMSAVVLLLYGAAVAFGRGAERAAKPSPVA